MWETDPQRRFRAPNVLDLSEDLVEEEEEEDLVEVEEEEDWLVVVEEEEEEEEDDEDDDDDDEDDDSGEDMEEEREDGEDVDFLHEMATLIPSLGRSGMRRAMRAMRRVATGLSAAGGPVPPLFCLLCDNELILNGYAGYEPYNTHPTT